MGGSCDRDLPEQPQGHDLRRHQRGAAQHSRQGRARFVRPGSSSTARRYRPNKPAIASGRPRAASDLEEQMKATVADSIGSAISRRTFMGASAALAASGFPAIAQTEAPSPKRGGILKVSTYLNPSRLDPFTGNSAVDQTV